MAKFVVEGGKKLSGTLKVNSAKNSAVSILCASLMVQGDVVLENVPKIQEVYRILEILASIGVKVKWENSRLILDTKSKLEMENINRKACESVRSSLMLMGALAGRVKQYKLYKSGGCRLGQRTVKPHLFALQKFGVEVISKLKYYDIKNSNLRSANIVMYEQGDTPTENAIMAAILAPGKTIIKFASANYMVQDLCYFLNEAGAKISGIGTSVLQIEGVNKLQSVHSYPIMPDPIEAMSFIALACTTKSNLVISSAPVDFLELELEKLSVMGQKFTILKNYKSANDKFNLVDIKFLPSKLISLPDKIHAQPYPGINIDNLPFFVPILTQAKGRTLVHDWIYEDRAINYLDLQKLGAKITLLDLHRVFVEGPVKLQANELMCPPAIRPAMVVLIAMLAAKGKSVLRNPYTIERGYENIAERLTFVGAKIKREE